MKNKPADIPYGGLDAEKIHSAKPRYAEDTLKLFREFVFERYKIHLRKDVQREPSPWTENPILREYKFTNVRREHDRTTKHLIALLKAHESSSYNDKLMNIILYRLFNKMETIDRIGWVKWLHYNEEDVREKLMSTPKDVRIYTDAFMVSGMMREMNKQFPEEKFTPMNIPNVLNKNKFDIVKSIKRAENPLGVIEALREIPGVSDFLAYQMFVDFTYLPEFPWSENEFVLSGPGCRRGLSALFGYDDGLSPEELLFWLRDNPPFTHEELFELMVDLPEHERRMNVMSLENCMCELSKYVKAVRGTGKPRNKYKYNKEM